jgi:prepilin-type N-terminal cleavage/methylation domain-containing protein
MKFIRKRKNNKAAFSLIEMMTVIFIVAVGLVGTTQLIAQSLDAQMINRGGIVAYQLAQEGIEIVRQKRDSNWLAGADWREGLTSGSYCTDYKYPLTLRSVSGINECPLHLDANNWYYAPLIFSESSFSGFRRVIEISDHDTNSISVKAIVTWNNRSKVLSYEAETYLYNWY